MMLLHIMLCSHNFLHPGVTYVRSDLLRAVQSGPERDGAAAHANIFVNNEEQRCRRASQMQPAWHWLQPLTGAAAGKWGQRGLARAGGALVYVALLFVTRHSSWQLLRLDAF